VATVLPGVALLPAVAPPAGAVAAVAEHQVGAEMAVAQLTVVVMEVELPMVVVMVHELLMVEQLHMEALPRMAAEHLTAATMAPAPRMEVSTLVIVRQLGAAHPATPPSHLVVSRRLPLAHTTRRHQEPMQHLLPVLMVHTRHPHPAVPWMRQHQETSRPRRLEILGTSTAQHLLLHRHRVRGNLLRRHRVVKIRATIEVLTLGV
jgi:hypothetical protein